MTKSIKSASLQLWAIVLCALLGLQPAIGRPAAGQSDLRIVVVQGDGARNVVQQITGTPIVVRVEDGGLRAVGANVIFTAPSVGAGGEFSNDMNTISVITGPDGQASAGPYIPNATTGSYRIQIRAEYQGRFTTATIAQRNDGPGGGNGKTIAIILGIIGAAAGAAVAAGMKNDGSGGPSENPPVISFGGGAVGAPTP